MIDDEMARVEGAGRVRRVLEKRKTKAHGKRNVKLRAHSVSLLIFKCRFLLFFGQGP